MGKIIGQNQLEHKSILKTFKQIKPGSIMKAHRAGTQSNTSILDRLLNATLEESGLSAQRIFKRDLNMQELIQKVLDDVNKNDQFKNVDFHLLHLPQIKGDFDQLRHLFKHLILNACLYRSSARPEIIISSDEIDNRIIFSVQDNGIGIDKAHQNDIFKPFNRGVIKNECKGVGLGLAICKRIVQNHDGDIWVQSLGRGYGCTFYVSFPTLSHVSLSVKRASRHEVQVLTSA